MHATCHPAASLEGAPGRTVSLGRREKIKAASHRAHAWLIYGGELGLVALVYFLAARAGLTMALAVDHISPLWPPTGIALAAMLRLGLRFWPSIALGAFLANALAGGPLASAGMIAIGNTLEALVGAMLLRRVGFQASLERISDVLALVLIAAMLSTLASATIGPASLCVWGLGAWDDFAFMLGVWWLGDAIGALVYTPLLLSCWQWPAKLRGWRRALEAGIGVLGAIGMSWVALAGSGNHLTYTVFPFVIWSAVRFGLPGATTVCWLVSSIATWGALQGRGPFVGETVHESLIILQAYVAILALVGLSLGAICGERERARNDLRTSQDDLKQTLHAAQIGAWSWNSLTDEVSWSPELEAIHGLAPGTFGGTFADFLATVRPEDRAMVLQSIQQAQQTGDAYEVQYCAPQADGRLLWMEGRGRALFDARGKPIGMRGTCMDITKRKAAEEKSRRVRNYLCCEHAIGRILAGAASLPDAAPQILETLCKTFDWDVGSLWLVDRQAMLLRCAEFWHAPEIGVAQFEEACRHMAFPSGVGLPGRVWSTGKRAWIRDVSLDANFPRATIAAREGLHGAAGFPIWNRQELLGVIEFFSREIGRPDEALLKMLASISNQMSQFAGRRRAEHSLLAREHEFSVARRIQQRLLPKAEPLLAGFDIAGGCQLAQETGGDFFDFLHLPDGRLAIAVGDASGHGIGAALLMADTCACLRTAALVHTEVEQILALINRRLARDTGGDVFVTMFLAGLDPARRELVYSSAGHLSGYVLDADGEIRHMLQSTGIPLAAEDESCFPRGSAATLEPGMLLLLTTDGLIEAFDETETMFGIERTLEIVRQHQQQPAHEIVASLWHNVNAFSSGPRRDDMTAVVVKVD